MSNHVSALSFILLFVAVLFWLFYRAYDQASNENYLSRDISNDLKQFLETANLFPEDTIDNDDALRLKSTQDIDNENTDEYVKIPKELINYQFLMNPVRLAILKTVFHSDIESAEIREQLHISWGKYTSHLNALENKGYIFTDTQFIDEQPKKVVGITPTGIKEFTDLTSLLSQIV